MAFAIEKFNVYDKHINRRAVIGIIGKLLTLKMLVVMPNGLLNKDYKDRLNYWDQSRINWPSDQVISAPETVHWAVSFKSF